MEHALSAPQDQRQPAGAAGADTPSATRPLRVLFLAPFAPRLDAAHGGSRVIAQLIGAQAAQHQVGICYLHAPDEPSIDPITRRHCEVVEEVVIPTAGTSALGRWRHFAQVWTAVLAGKPLWAIGRSAAAYSQRVRQIARAWRPDVIQLEYHIMGQYLPALAGCPAPRVLVEHEPGKEAARELQRAGQTRGRMMPHLDLLAWHRFEPAVIRQVQAVVAFTERDQRALARLKTRTPVVRIPLGTPLPERPLSAEGGRPLSVLFVGNFMHAPNAEAAVRLMRDIYPCLQAQFPELLLHVVGSQPPSSVRRLASEQVTVAGWVPDVQPYLDRAAVVAMPLRLGGGMRVKVLEALAAGKAVVASRLAVEGLDLVDGEQVLLADSDEDFCAAVARLLGDAQLRARLGKRARAWACQHLGWAGPAEEYHKLYERLLAGNSID